MAEPVLGKDVILQVKKTDLWLNYACATDVTIDFAMEEISVKTIGDGVWAKPAGQSKSYQINLSGLVKFDDDTVPHAFDLYNYFDSMVPVEYRMIFTDDADNTRVFEGLALPVGLSLGGGSEGFANGSATLKGYGAPTVDTVVSSCTAEITAATVVLLSGENGLQVTAVTGGPITRYEFSFDGAEARTTRFVDGTLPDDILIGNAPGGGVGSFHDVTVWPICADGNDGEPYTFQIENLP